MADNGTVQNPFWTMKEPSSNSDRSPEWDNWGAETSIWGSPSSELAPQGTGALCKGSRFKFTETDVLPGISAQGCCEFLSRKCGPRWAEDSHQRRLRLTVGNDYGETTGTWPMRQATLRSLPGMSLLHGPSQLSRSPKSQRSSLCLHNTRAVLFSSFPSASLRPHAHWQLGETLKK